jgi:archaeosine-15-forming tRNA-guanine transglycosylase
MKKRVLLIFFAVCLFACKRGVIKPDSSSGMLRVECNDCEVRYITDKKESIKQIKDGDADIEFSYKAGKKLHTQVLSQKEQNIRVLVIDSSGEVISNQLSFYSIGEIRSASFSFDSN